MSTNERGKVWLLEDSRLEAEMARRALAPTHDVLTFDDGSVVLERTATGTVPDVLVLDWQLPGVTGIEVCRALRARHGPSELPILMLTAQGEKRDVVEALAAGANDYLTKPYDVAELVARVGTHVRASHLGTLQRERARQLTLAADVGAALTKGRGLREIAARCGEVIAKNLDAHAVEIWTKRDGLYDLTSAVGGRGATGVPPSSRPSSALAPAAPSPRIPSAFVVSVGEGRRPVLIDDVSAEPALASSGLLGAPSSTSASPLPAPPVAAPVESGEFGRRSEERTRPLGLIALPLVVEDRDLGVLAVCLRAPLADAAATLSTVADLLALGIARSRVEEERLAILERERATRGDAEAANRSKDEFLAMVSHELRTPLNAITGWASMLLEGRLDPDRTRRAVETIHRNARAQAQLIDDLLDISRIISGKLRLNAASVDVASVAESALESVRLAAEAREVTLEASLASEDVRVTGDDDRIRQIVWNLLSNAIKFTPKGGRVTLLVARDERGVAVTVEDTGQGIAADFLPRVFERFKQADGSATRSRGGLGLGLAIVRHLVELHGGTVDARSEGLGKGASFVAVFPPESRILPRQLATSAVIEARQDLERPREVEGLRVLVVDDEADARELLRTLLESCKIEVTAVASASEAYDVVRSRPLDVILSDIAMPDEDGLSFIRRVRLLPREEGGRVHAIALTAYARLEDRMSALRAGFNTHVAKPVVPNELLAVLSSVATSR